MRRNIEGQLRAPVVLVLLVTFIGSLLPVQLLAQPYYSGPVMPPNYTEPPSQFNRPYPYGYPTPQGLNSLIPGTDPSIARNPAQGGLGRTLGGVAGIAAGSFGGAALAATIIKAAGLASLGPVVPIVVGTAITAGGAFLGAKLLSGLGQSGDRFLGASTEWTIAGAMVGAVLGYALIPALGPFAGPAGRVIAAGVAALAGGVLAKLFSNQLTRVATPRNIMAGAGAVIGAVGFGPVGAVAGAAGGYALGAVFGDSFFANPYSSPGQYINQVGWEFSNSTNRFTNWTHRIEDWFENKSDRLRYGLNGDNGYYNYPSGYYDDYTNQQMQQYAYDNIGYGSQPSWQMQQVDYGNNFNFSAGININSGGSLREWQMRDQQAYSDYMRAQQSGDSMRFRQSYDSYRQIHQQYQQMQQQGYR